jgi:hypothetical protein
MAFKSAPVTSPISTMTADVPPPPYVRTTDDGSHRRNAKQPMETFQGGELSILYLELRYEL